MESLIPVINKLQVVFKKAGLHDQDKIELPEIVVVGSQSCGKSSVLESLVKKSILPRGSGMVTRCPIVLQLHQTDGDEYCCFAAGSEANGTAESGRQFEFEKVQAEIERITAKIPGSKKCISKDRIIIEVYSPSVINLTVVDLPGLVKIPVDGQPADIEEQIRGLIMEHAKNSQAIILAVSPANADIATSESIKLAKEVDPEGKRTLAVVTKLDLMDRGTNANDVLEGKTVVVQLGLIGVVNRSQQDLNENKSVADAIQYEEDYISRNYPDLKERMGSKYLAMRLHSLLSEHIRKALPDLKKRIGVLTENCDTELKALGKAIGTSPEAKIFLMMEEVQDFLKKFKNSLGDPRFLAANEEKGFVGKINEIFNRFGISMVLPFTDKEELLNSRIRRAVLESINIEKFVDTENAFKTIVKEEIELFERPSVSCAMEVHALLEEIIDGLLEKGRFRKLNAVIALATQKVLSSQLKETKDALRQTLTIEKDMILSSDPEFVKLLQEYQEAVNPGTSTSNNSGLSFPMIVASDSKAIDGIVPYLQTAVIAYINVMRRQFTDSFRKCIVYHLFKRSANERFKEEIIDISQGQASTLICEPEDIVGKRRDKTLMLKNLHEATEILYSVIF